MAPGLREKKRAALERDLARTAYDLVQDRGFALVTVDDIVAAAGVSRRTFSNYYSCKEEAVAALAVHRAAAALDAWAPGPGQTSLVAVMRDLVAHQFDSGSVAAMVAVADLCRDHHQLVPYLREAQWRLWSAAGARVLEALADHDPARRAELTAVVGAVFGVVSSALIPGALIATPDRPEGASPAAVRGLVDHVLDRLAAGFG